MAINELQELRKKLIFLFNDSELLKIEKLLKLKKFNDLRIYVEKKLEDFENKISTSCSSYDMQKYIEYNNFHNLVIDLIVNEIDYDERKRIKPIVG